MAAGAAALAGAASFVAGSLLEGFFSSFLASTLAGADAAGAGVLAGSAANTVVANTAAIKVAIDFMIFPSRLVLNKNQSVAITVSIKNVFITITVRCLWLVYTRLWLLLYYYGLGSGDYIPYYASDHKRGNPSVRIVVATMVMMIVRIRLTCPTYHYQTRKSYSL